MKQTGLWSRLNRKYRAKLRERMGERGAAMMLAILFVMVVLTTSALVMTTLFAQAIPYKNNKENSQANYAAESGLEVGLSYLDEVLSSLSSGSSSVDLRKLLPNDDANESDASKDTRFTRYDGASVLLNNTMLNDKSSTNAISYTPDDLSYRVRINFYKDNPDSASSGLITTPDGLKDVKYAEVVAASFIGRYANGRSSSSQPMFVKRAVCKLEVVTNKNQWPYGGRKGMGFYAAAPYTNLKKQPVWVRLDNSGTDAVSSPSGELKFIGNTDGHWETNLNDLTSGDITMNPLNRTCMLATTSPIVDASGSVLSKKSIAQNLDLNNKPQAGSGLIIMPEAYYANNGTYQYTEECRTDGAYSTLNTWLYYPDNSIRLGSDTSLCVTGGSIDKYNSPATLQPCGTSYGPRVKDGVIQWNDSSYVNPYYPELAKNDQEKQEALANQDKEKRDPNSLLNKYQKWIFYNGFINAGYLNDTNHEDIRQAAADYDSGLPESKGYSVGGLQPKEQTKFMRLEPTHWGGSPSDEGDAHFAGGNMPATQYNQAYVVARWAYNFNTATYDIGGDMQNATASFGQAGEAGYGTQQIVNSSSGFCMVLNGSNVYADTCDIRTGDWDAKCFQKSIVGQGSAIITMHFCAAADENNYDFTSDRADYDEDMSANGTGQKTTIRLYDKDGNVKYLVASGENVSFTDKAESATQFTRYNERNKHTDPTFTSVDGKEQHPWAGTFQTSDNRCLTEIYPGDYIESKDAAGNVVKNFQYKGSGVTSSPENDGSGGHSILKIEQCGVMRDSRGRRIKSQVWNAAVDFGDKGNAGALTIVHTSLSTTSAKFIMSGVDISPSKVKW